MGKPRKPGSKKHADYSLKLADEICEAIANSRYGLNKICADNPHFPARRTIFKWVIENKEFAEKYKYAKMLQAELLVEELLSIADDGSNDTAVDDEGQVTINFDHIQRSRLRVDTRKWMAGKLAPRIYGEKVMNEHTGKDGEPIKVDKTSGLSEDERITRLDEILKRARARRAARSPTSD